MDKGQHLRLLIVEGSGTPTKSVIALSTSCSLSLNAATEDSTTKDTTDTNGSWNEYEITTRSGEIQVDALVGVGTDATGKDLEYIMNNVSDTPVDWELALVSGDNNRTVSTVICSGKGKFSNVNPQAQVGQNAAYSATLNIYGPVTVPA